MPSLDPLRQRVSEAIETGAGTGGKVLSKADRTYAKALLEEVEESLPALKAVDDELAKAVAKKDALVAKVEEAKSGLREINARRDPLSAALNEKIRTLGVILGDELGGAPPVPATVMGGSNG